MRTARSRRVYVLAVMATLGLAAFLAMQQYTPDLLRCDPSLGGTSYYEVQFGIDYATQLDRLFPAAGVFSDRVTTGRLQGRFLMEWPATPPGRPRGEFKLRVVDFVVAGIDDSPSAEATADLTEFDVRLDDSCGLVLSPETAESADGGELVSRLVSLFTFSVPQRRLAAWEAEHEDNLGAYRARYQLDSPAAAGQVITRQKDAYLYLSSADRAQDLVPKVIESSALARFSPGGRWLHELEGIDDVSLLHEGRAVAQTRVTYSVRKIEDGFAWQPRRKGLMEVPSTHAAPRADEAETQADDDLARPADGTETHRLRTATLFGPESLDVLSDANLEQLGVPVVLGIVVGALQADPALAYALRDAIYTGSLGREGAPLAFLALQKAGTDEAAAVLIEMLENDSAAPMTRSRAVYALAAARPDSMVVVQILAGRLARAGAEPSLTDRSALLAMGMMLDRIEAENDPAKVLLRQLIGEHLSRARDDAARRAALAASYNAADAALYPLVTPYLEDPSPSIRALAVEAIGKSAATSSRSALLRHYAKEQDGGVRAATLDALTALARGAQAQDPGEAPVASIASALRSEVDARVRAAMIRYLAAHANDSEARAALAAQAATETDPALLKEIGTILTPEELLRIRR